MPLLVLPLHPNICHRVPKENRLLWVDAVEIVWVTILSKKAAEQAAEQEREKER